MATSDKLAKQVEQASPRLVCHCEENDSRRRRDIGVDEATPYELEILNMNKTALNKQVDQEIQDIRLFAREANSNNTERAYFADWKHFLGWCKRKNKSPLPANPDDVATYLRFCAERERLKLSTVTRRISAISEAHKRNDHETPTEEWVVRNTMRKLRRELGKPAISKKPLLAEDIKKMITKCPPTLEGKRDKALLLICFAGAFKRSELVSINFEDVAILDEGIIIQIKGSKTDQKREGRKVAIPYGQNKDTCPVTALLDWLDGANITDGPLLRSLNRYGRPKPFRMSDRVVAELVKKYSALIGKRIKGFSGHSLRAGFATSAAIAGASEASIQKQTGHKSLLVLRRYIRDASLFTDHASYKIGL